MNEVVMKKINTLEYIFLFLILISYSEYLFVFYNGIVFFEYMKYFIGLFFIYNLIKSWEFLALTAKDNKVLIIFLLYVTLSVLWTPGYSNISRIFSLLVNFSVALFIIKRFTVLELLKFLRVFFLFILISSYVTVILFPDIGIESGVHSGSWNGVFGQKNRAGIVLVYSLITTIVLMISETKIKKIDIGSFFLTIIFIINTNSSTAIMICLLSIFISFSYYMFTKCNKLVRIVFLIFASVILISTYFFISYISPAIKEFTGKDLTLTGRTFIWNYLLNENKGVSVLIGNGYGYYWSNFNESLYRFYNAIGFVTTTAHNGFIDIILDLGYVGLFLFIILLIISLVGYIYNFTSYNLKVYTLWPILILICMIPYNFSESLFISYNSLSIVFVFCSIIYISKISDYRELA
ncbi:O-antigen ligase [Exiguobacterium sp. s102]|uniref:O-antigen ligase family protein n=1 Tax=Exiguobacterium sp. s102 TaxID=2751212 RepID=UPI001BE5E69F|nr:O-antigen ligase family protein [Exiguobacterium sp. s102]